MSTYDKIHDAHLADDVVKKRGAKYERLVAVVAASLNLGAVKHDVRLIGESSVKHQIDVHIGSRRVLIECKDLDLSHDKVGLDTVQAFATVARDLKPDESWIVTCVGFTREARKMAKHERIRLILLREFTDDDWEGRIRKIAVQLSIKSDHEHRVTFRAGPSREADLTEALHKFGERAPLHSPKTGIMVTVAGAAPVDIQDWLEGRHKEFDVLNLEDGAHSKTFVLPDATITVGTHGIHPISGITIDFVVRSISQMIFVDSGNKIALLLLQGLGTGDMVVWDTDLMRFDIDPESGEVQQRAS